MTGWTDSIVATAAYTIAVTIATPTFGPQAGTYSSDQSVTISCATSGAVICYNTDGSIPTGDSSLYSAPLSVAGNGVSETIKAIATAPGMSASSVGSSSCTTYDEWHNVGAQGSSTNQFKYPAGVAVDASGRIYAADMINNRIVSFIMP